jgi:hypothetical protein
MKLLVLYHKNSDHETACLSFRRDLERFHPEVNVEMMSIETREGQDIARLYDATQYPSLIAVAEGDNRFLSMWQGQPFPLMNEVASYAVGES